MTFAELLAAKHPRAWLDFERGALEEAAFLESFFADGRLVDGPGLRAAMADAYAWLPGMEALLARVHAAGYTAHAFSNYPDWWRMVEARLRLSRYLSWTAVSCLPAMRAARKPEPEAFAAAAAAAGGAAPHAHILIVRGAGCAQPRTPTAQPVLAGADASRARPAQDDRLQNVEAARAAGWAAIHFTGATELEVALAELGVTLP
jgi:FMN phosphatase YigB (HAD superfamily)